MAKPFGVVHAVKVLSKHTKRAPKDHWEWRDVLDVLRRLPPEVDDDLVVAALVHDMKERKVKGSQANCLLTAIPSGGVAPNPDRWARAVVLAMKRFPKDPNAAFYLAALPKNEKTWSAYMVRMDTAHNALAGLWNTKRLPHAARERLICRVIADPAVVAGARAAARLAKPSKFDGWWWFLAADGDAASLALLETFVKVVSKHEGRDAADWLAADFAPLMTSKETAALRARLVGTVEKRNKSAPGVEVARTLGVDGPLRFKVGLYADGGMPRIRLWVDGSKDPWFDARWNWDELVHWPKSKQGTPPVEELRAFLRSCLKDGEGRFRTWELATAHRGAAKAKLVALIAAELPGLTGPHPASAPLRAFKG